MWCSKFVCPGPSLGLIPSSNRCKSTPHSAISSSICSKLRFCVFRTQTQETRVWNRDLSHWNTHKLSLDLVVRNSKLPTMRQIMVRSWRKVFLSPRSDRHFYTANCQVWTNILNWISKEMGDKPTSSQQVWVMLNAFRWPLPWNGLWGGKTKAFSI